jgi:DNA uptake protein ComE-like DNA-binding protein
MDVFSLPRVRTLAAAGALLVVLVFAGRVLIPVGAPESSRAAAPVAPPTVSRGVVVVHVVGGVRRPGLYRLPLGSRVADAVRRAGGPTRRADTQLVNLAAPLADGTQVVVPLRQPPPSAGGTSATAGTAPSGPVHLNTATLEELDALPGVGPVTAQKILNRAPHDGPCRRVAGSAAPAGISPVGRRRSFPSVSSCSAPFVSSGFAAQSGPILVGSGVACWVVGDRLELFARRAAPRVRWLRGACPLRGRSPRACAAVAG